MQGRADADPPPGGVRGFVAWLLGKRPVTEHASKRRPPVSGAESASASHVHVRPVPVVSGSQPNWLRVLGADALLQTVQAHKAITEIARLSRLSPATFERDGLAALRCYAEFVQLLPASEAHHHAHAGGLLAHTVEMLLAALARRNGYFLPEGSPIETIDAQRDEWTLVVFYAALLHDIGKVLADLRITWRAQDLEAVRWMPLAGSLPQLAQGRARAEYLVEFTARVERDYGAHSKTAVLLLQRIASPQALATLARQPVAFEALNRYLSGQDKDSLLARIVRDADKASVQRALTSGSRARFATARAVPLVDLLMGALRAMLRDGTALPLNRSGAAGWVYDGSLWLVAKRVADATRAYIQKHESDEAVPGETKNDRLFDTWQEYGCIVPYPGTGQAIWYVTVQGRGTNETEAASGEAEELEQGAYAHNLTMLRFRLDKLWDDPGQYPPPMAGTIQVHDKRKAGTQAEAEAGRDEEGPETQALPDTPGSEAAASGSAQDAAPERDSPEPERKPKSGKPPVKAAPAQPSTPVIKAPTFNKPRPPVSAPAPAPATAQPAPAQATRPVKQAAADTPETGAMGTAPASVPSSGQAVEDASDIADMADDEAAYLLDPGDRANASAINREQEQRLLAKAARQAQKPVTAPLKPVATPEPTNRTRLVGEAPLPQAPRRLLAQPVGGVRHLRLPTVPITTARSDVSKEPANPASVKPVVLEPKVPRLSRKDKIKREAVESPVALAFIGWLQKALAERAVKYNETGAAVHFVEHGMALVSPLIFKLYAATQVPEAEIAEHAMQVQREVIKARWHVTGPGNTNILRYQVLGRGGTPVGSKLAAVVLTEPGRFVQPVPPANPVLRLDGSAGATNGEQEASEG